MEAAVSSEGLLPEQCIRHCLKRVGTAGSTVKLLILEKAQEDCL